MRADYKSGFVTLIGRTECREIYIDELSDRTEDRDYIEQTRRTNKKSNPDRFEQRRKVRIVLL
mgnify:CR=1 FL=1